MKKGEIEKVGFRKYCLWINETTGLHFTGWKNVIQAKHLLEILGSQSGGRG